MKTIYNLSSLEWKLSGWTPYVWQVSRTAEIGASPEAEVPQVKATVPGSVQSALREAGVIPDWNVGLNARACEWVENRHWVYETNIPDVCLVEGMEYRLNCLGLDYSGWVFLNGVEVGKFEGTFTPHVFDLTEQMKDSENILRIVFDVPPRWLGQFGYTSRMTDWKPRFNYTWDWTMRLVQTGIWDSIFLEVTDANEIMEFRCFTHADSSSEKGAVAVFGYARADEGSIKISISRDEIEATLAEVGVEEFNENGITCSGLLVDLWWPNGMGEQILYDLKVQLLDSGGNVLDEKNRAIGFKEVTWEKCLGACGEADPWICVVNGRQVFIQGANWTPILPNFADAVKEDYEKRMSLYKDLGFNMLRVWGGAYLEKSWFYDLCDEMGIMVWQEFPLSSSGGESCPPEDERSIREMTEIARSYIERRQHHVSLVIWCGGNELVQTDFTTPVDSSHPLIGSLGEIIDNEDPARRFLATSPSGPRFCAGEQDYGKGIHWDIHGPWKAEGDLSEQWARYWNGDDSCFRSETGAPGASSLDIIRRYQGELTETPYQNDNWFWRRPMTWWLEFQQFNKEMGRDPLNLEEYVVWSRERQKQALVVAVAACKKRFPACGGIILWMGHDCFPCPANTSIIDFDGNPKPAAIAIGEIFKKKPEEL